MSRSRKTHALTAFAVLALTTVFSAYDSSANDSKKVNTTLAFVTDATIAGKQVKAGEYDVKATQSSLQLLHNGKLVAESPVEWKDEQSKPRNSSVVTDNGAVKEIHFAGKERYVELGGESATMSTGKH